MSVGNPAYTVAGPAGASSGLYLLHFDPRYRHAGHYLGHAASIPDRVRAHVHGGQHRSPLVMAAVGAGSRVTLTRVWLEGDRKLERRLKRQGSLSRHCPTCRARGTFHA